MKFFPILFFLLLIGCPLTKSDSPIKNVIVLVMENRSFDHMLGWMKALNPAINGVNGSETNPVSTTDPKSPLISFKDQAHYVDPDPGHSFQAIREQIFGSDNTSADPAPMNGFVQNAKSMDANMTDAVMNGFQPDKVAVYKELVSQFAVFDRWFASVPASTQPNRLYVHSGTSHGAMSNKPELLALGYPQRTIFDNLDDEGYSFNIYFQDIPAILFYRSLRQLKFIPKFHPYDSDFKKHCKEGSLPNYSVIEQRYTDKKDRPATDDHPSHDVYQGQLFVKEVYESLRASPQWNQSLLIITYDEHGGFYDHVPTPKNVPSPDGIVGVPPYYFKFDRLGVRVPTIMVSPWIEKGTVVHGPNGKPAANSEYEHSSIPATMKILFNLKAPYLTKRDAWAGTFEGILQTRKEPRTDCPETLPNPVQVRMTEANEEAKLTEFQQELVQLGAALNGDHMIPNFHTKVIPKMNVRDGGEYMRNAVRRFLEAGRAAIKMGVDGEHIVKMRPSLTSRTNPKAKQP